GWPEASTAWRGLRAVRLRALRLARKFLGHYRFNSITRRIIVLNLLGVAILVSGIFYLSQYRVKFIETRVESLATQAAIIASAIAQTSKNNADSPADSGQQAGENKIVVPQGIASPDLSFRIDPEIVSPMLRDLVGPTKTRARVFDTDGTLISDSKQPFARSTGGRPDPAEGDTDILGDIWSWLKAGLWAQDLPLYRDMG